MFILFTLVVSFLSIVALVKRITFDKNARYLNSHRKALLVTAHPDDECMFFAPVVLGLLKAGIQVQLLCLSSGGFYGQNAIREREIKRSCDVLGIMSGNCTVLDHSELPDNPTVDWSPQLVADIVASHIEKTGATLVVSFDAHGVSSHANHRALYHGLRLLQKSENTTKETRFYRLETVPLFRKYIGVLDIPWSFVGQSLCFVSSWTEVLTAQRAMTSHRSQLQWFRILYIAFSRYMFVNTLLPIQQ